MTAFQQHSSKTWLQQSLRLLHHELRRGELTIIALSIIFENKVYNIEGSALSARTLKTGLLKNIDFPKSP